MSTSSVRPRRLAVVAHYDASHRLAHHVRLLLQELLGVCEQVVLVSTTGVDYSAAVWASEYPNLKVVTRKNQGYDFMSYREGLRHLGDVAGAEVFICNDSFVGPVVPLTSILDRMEPVECDFWGMTESFTFEWHVQSYFMVFRPAATRSAEFRAFWEELEPLSDRFQVITRYELGLSRRLASAGLVGRAYFEPDAHDTWEANARHDWWSVKPGPNGCLPAWREKTLERYLHPRKSRDFNSTVVLADRILDGRLPILKLEVVRLDPFALGGAELLQECRRKYPRWFERVGQYIRDTDGAVYAGRHDTVPITRDTQPISIRVRYHRPERRL